MALGHLHSRVSNLERFRNERVARVPRLSGARVYNTTNQTLTSGSAANITMDSERFDVGAYHSTSSNTARLTAIQKGIYLIIGNAQFAANATGQRILGIYLNNTTWIARENRGATSGVMDITVSAIYQLDASDYVTLRADQNSGGNLDIVAAGNYSPEFAIWRIN